MVRAARVVAGLGVVLGCVATVTGCGPSGWSPFEPSPAAVSSPSPEQLKVPAPAQAPARPRLRDGFTVADGSRLVGKVHTIESGKADSWYATIVVTKDGRISDVVRSYRGQMLTLRFSLHDSSPTAVHGFRRAHRKAGLSAGAATLRGTYADVTASRPHGRVPGYLRLVVTDLNG